MRTRSRSDTVPIAKAKVDQTLDVSAFHTQLRAESQLRSSLKKTLPAQFTAKPLEVVMKLLQRIKFAVETFLEWYLFRCSACGTWEWVNTSYHPDPPTLKTTKLWGREVPEWRGSTSTVREDRCGRCNSIMHLTFLDQPKLRGEPAYEAFFLIH